MHALNLVWNIPSGLVDASVIRRAAADELAMGATSPIKPKDHGLTCACGWAGIQQKNPFPHQGTTKMAWFGPRYLTKQHQAKRTHRELGVRRKEKENLKTDERGCFSSLPSAAPLSTSVTAAQLGQQRDQRAQEFPEIPSLTRGGAESQIYLQQPTQAENPRS